MQLQLIKRHLLSQHQFNKYSKLVLVVLEALFQVQLVKQYFWGQAVQSLYLTNEYTFEFKFL